MADRERFEAWAKSLGYNVERQERKPDDYKVLSITMLWDAWQAAHRELEEACAAIKAEDDRSCDEDYMLDSNDCIRVVRALAGSTEGR